jgi:hypothetical protein
MSGHRCSCYHRTRNTPSFISWACAVDLSNGDWKSAPAVYVTPDQAEKAGLIISKKWIDAQSVISKPFSLDS